MEILQTYQLTKKYKNLYATQDVDIHIEEGDIYGFVGENGAGKTTIIRMIAGLTIPTKGSYRLFGVDSTTKEITAARSQMAGLVETASIARNLNALDNLKLQAMIIGVKKTDEELKALLDIVGLTDVASSKKKAGQFSLGMRQRLGIALVMVSNPKFVMLDEPMNGLDPQGFIDVREVILKLNQQGVTFLISSHILSELEKICTKVGFISHGKMVEELSIEELHDKSRRHIVLKIGKGRELLPQLQRDLVLFDVNVNEDTLTIFDDISVDKVVTYCVNNHLEILNINCNEETIEDYYLQLMSKGGQNA